MRTNLGLNTNGSAGQVARQWDPHRRLRSFALVLFSVLLPARALLGAGADPDGQLRATRWTSADGLPKNKVQCVQQDRNGYLWVGTQHGLARFDGVRFKTMDRMQRPGEAPPAINVLAEDKRDGSLWVGTTEGLFRLAGDETARFGVEHGLPHRKVWRLCSCSNGDLWLGTDGGLARLRNGRFERITQETLGGTTSSGARWFLERPDGHVWLGNDYWRRDYDPATGKFNPLPLGGLPGELDISTVAAARDGSLLVGTSKGMWRVSGDRREWYERANGLAEPWIMQLFEDSTGQVWVATKENGFYRLAGNRFEAVNLGSQIGAQNLDGIAEDREGNLWLAASEGLLRLRWLQVRTFTEEDGLLDNKVASCLASPDGTVYFGSRNGVTRLAEGIFSRYRLSVPASEGNVRTLAIDRNGTVLAGAYRLFELAQGQFVARGRLDHVESVYADSSGTLWIGSTAGVRREGESGDKWFTTADGLGSNGGDVFLEDRRKNLWIGNADGLHRLANGKITRFTTRDGLPENSVRALHEDADGALWIGTENGLARFGNGQFRKFGESCGLTDLTINQILDDDGGYLWMGGLHGIHRVARSELNGVADGKISEARFVTFGEQDGMAVEETNGGIQPAGCRSPDGRLWFATLKGVAVVDPKQIRINDTPPGVVIEDIQVDNFPLKRESSAGWDKPFRLPPGSGRVLGIRYTATSLSAPERIRFKYMLEGHDKEWREADWRERTVYYTNLRPGDYRFRVKACNNHGLWNEKGAQFSFSLARRFSETRWFPPSLGALAVAVALALMAWRLRWERRLALAKQAAALDRERARIARDLHDDLGANVTGVALQADVALRDLANPEQLAQRLETVARNARSVVDQMREVVWAVNPHCDTVESFAAYAGQFAENYLSAADLRCRLDFPASFPKLALRSEARHALFLVVKEALHNVVKHAAATEARFRLEIAGTVIRIEIADNGRGAPAAKGAASDRGVANMRRRVEGLGGRFEWGSQPGQGATVALSVDLDSLPKQTESHEH